MYDSRMQGKQFRNLGRLYDDVSHRMARYYMALLIAYSGRDFCRKVRSNRSGMPRLTASNVCKPSKSTSIRHRKRQKTRADSKDGMQNTH
jgi:hypothetical protein